ncbi:MAG: hypothetical protein EBZ48_15355, partial [Proteobacteria bacterium]|nr:hypothetical protein [Pseudomonadota bacterium]
MTPASDTTLSFAALPGRGEQDPDLLPGQIASVMSITQRGITVQFNTARTVGRFATGDFWVLGPVEITAITPNTELRQYQATDGSTISRALHGLQV